MMRGPAGVLGLLLALAGPASAATVDALVLHPGGQAVTDAAVVLEPLMPMRAQSRRPIEQGGRKLIPYVIRADRASWKRRQACCPPISRFAIR